MQGGNEESCSPPPPAYFTASVSYHLSLHGPVSLPLWCLSDFLAFAVPPGPIIIYNGSELGPTNERTCGICLSGSGSAHSA